MDPVEGEVQRFAETVLTALRKGRGIDVTAAEGLKGALQKAADAWAQSETISKSAANLFIDLANGVSALRYSYGKDEGERIERLGDELAELVRRCVEVQG